MFAIVLLGNARASVEAFYAAARNRVEKNDPYLLPVLTSFLIIR